MAKAPCKNCMDRKLLCHGACQRYQVYKQELEEERKAKQREQDTYCVLPAPVRNELNRLSRYDRNRR